MLNRQATTYDHVALQPWEALRARLRAIVLDVDGTLYEQSRLRRRMAWRLARSHVGRPRALLRTVRIIRAYRAAQEQLRNAAPNGLDLALAQRQLAQQQLAAGSVAAQLTEVERCVTRWMENEPLDLIPGCVRAGVRRFLEVARARGLQTAVCSDYPAARKLAAMDLLDAFPVIVLAQDRDVQRFKPDPRGLEVALARLQVAATEALYVGDRPDVDAVAAARAGMACVIVGGAPPMGGGGTCLAVPGFGELHDALFDD